MLNIPHHAETEEQIRYNEIFQILVYEDDSLEISYKDSSSLQLSPCGSNFKFTRPYQVINPTSSRHVNEVSQRCVFATSETRVKIVEGLIIRNQLCSRPCVLPEFFYKMSLKPFRLYKILQTICWDQQDTESELVEFTADCSIVVHSRDKIARLELFADGSKVRVHFPVALSHLSTNSSPNCLKDGGSAAVRHMYVWQSRIFPASECPLEWQYPLKIALHKKYGNLMYSDENLVFEKNPAGTVPVVKSFPKKCSKQFQHRWRNIEPKIDHTNEANFLEGPAEFADSKIKYMWCKQGTYWILRGKSCPRIEVWLQNGSVFKSHPTTDRYFVHLSPSRENFTSFSEKILSAASIPKDPAVKSVMLRSIRLIAYKSQSNASMKAETPCWQIETKVCNALNNSSNGAMQERISLQENAEIPTVGTFSAVSDSVQISFLDGAMLHMILKMDDHKLHSDFVHFTSGDCRIVLKNGQHYTCENIDEFSSVVEKYVIHACSWVKWLSKSRSERKESPFYSDTIYDKMKIDVVAKAINDIKNLTGTEQASRITNLPEDFQYLELSGYPSITRQPYSCFDYEGVSTALSHTSKAIEDIDAMIASCRN